LSDQSRRTLLNAAEDEREAAEALALQARIAALFLTVPDDEMFNEVLKVILDVMHSPFGVFGYLDEAGALVVPTMTRQIWDKCQVPEKTIRFPRETWGDGSWPRAVREKKTVCSNEPSTNIPGGHVGIQRHISLPILFQGEVIGLFQVANKVQDYTEADIRTLAGIAGHVAPLLSTRLLRERAQEALRRLNAELEQRVRDSTAQLEAANQELEAFSYSISHDLRAPLRAMDGFASIWVEDHAKQLDAEGRRVIGVICAEAKRMGELIDDLLAFSRMSRQSLQSAEIDLGGLARTAFDQCVRQSPNRKCALTLHPLPPARGDPAMLRQVLVNLLSNAIKFTRQRDPAVIEVGVMEWGSHGVLGTAQDAAVVSSQNSNPPALQPSSTPTLQHSNPPALQPSSTPTLQHSNPPALQPSSGQYPRTPTRQSSSFGTMGPAST